VASWRNNPTPSAVAFDAKGQPHVSFLSSYAHLPGSARIDRITRDGPQVAVPGLTGVVDLAFGPDGALYVLEIGSQFLLQPAPAHWQEGSGRIVRVKEGSREVVYDGLNSPSKLAFAADGALFVTNNAGFAPAGSGEVLRLAPERVAARGLSAPPPQSPMPGPAAPAAAPPPAPPVAPAPQPTPRPAPPVQAPAQAPVQVP
jgi:glucose/arabinose dehydrogenase